MHKLLNVNFLTILRFKLARLRLFSFALAVFPVAIGLVSQIAIFETSARAQTLTERLINEDASDLAKQARENGNIVRGAILFHQGSINCAKCHRSTSERDRIGPDLSRMEKDVTDAFIVESILQPSKEIKEGFETRIALTGEGTTVTGIVVSEDAEKVVFRERNEVEKVITVLRKDIEEMRPGKTSNMPDDLVNQLKDRQQFLDLLVYVLDVKDRGPQTEIESIGPAMRRKLSPELNGMILMQKFNCVACHKPGAFTPPVAAKQAPRLAWSAKWLNPNYIESFIAQPHSMKPGTTMPSVLRQMSKEMQKESASSITHFITSLAGNSFASQPIDPESAVRGFEHFHSVGCVACHSPRDQKSIEVALDGSIPLGDVSGKYNVEGLTRFLKDPNAVRPSGHMPDMTLKHREAVDLANFLLQPNSQDSKSVRGWKYDSALADKGKALFNQLDCASCHSELTNQPSKAASKVALDALNPTKGCMSGENGDWPNFNLSSDDHDSIQAALRQYPNELSPSQKIDSMLVALNCTACHTRDDLGGVDDARSYHFKTTNLNLGDQGRIPPTLTNVGAKLNPDWMRDVMVNRRSIRPYMETRMPQYGEKNIAQLLTLLESTDRLVKNSEFAAFEDQKKMRETGLKLAGHKGLNCVACHTFQYKPSDTMPAVDLTEMTERLKKDWFYQYMLAPQTFSPNTVMPSYWPHGKAIRKDIEGTPEDQLEALWQYLIDGRQARAPSGVVRKPLDITVNNEAQMLRRKYPGIGKRGIGVGYPGGMNIAFDAEQLRLAMIWKGPFAEASGVWRGQGSGSVRPMSRPFNFGKGPDLDDATAPWAVDDGRPPKHQFKGYMLDKDQRPTFRYQFDAVEVTDFFREFNAKEDGEMQLKRVLTFSSEAKSADLNFRIATAPSIKKANGRYLIGERLKVRVLSSHQARLRADNGVQQLEIPLSVEPGKTIVVSLEYVLD